MNFPMIVLLCFVCCLFSCRVTKDRRTLTGIVVMGRTYKRRSKSLEATALEIIVTDTGNTALKLEVPGCKDYVALRLNRHEVKKFKEALIACGNEPMVVTLFQYKVNGKHCYILYHEPGKEDSYPKFDGAKEDELKTKCRTARNIAFVLYGFSLILYPLAWWVSVILIVAASILIYLNIPLLDDELWFDSCEFIKRPKQVKGKNSDSDIVASQASIILEEISEKYQDKGKSDKDYEQHQETSAKPPEKEPTKDSKKPETSAPIDNNEPVNVKVNIHTEINPEPSEILDVLEDESEPIVPPAPKSASTPESADATKPFDAADIFEPEPELEPKPEKEPAFDLPVDDDDTRDPFAEEDSDSPAGLSCDPSGVDMDDDKKDPFVEDDGNVFNPPDDVNEHEEEPGMDMMDLDVPAPPEPDIVDAPTLEQEQAGFRLDCTQQIHNNGRIRAPHSKVNDSDILRRSHPHVRPITGLRKLKLFTEYIYVIIEIGQQNILPEVGQGMLCIAWQPIFHDFRFRFHCFCVFLFPLYPAKDRGVFHAKLANDYVKPSTISHKSDKAGRPDGRLR